MTLFFKLAAILLFCVDSMILCIPYLYPYGVYFGTRLIQQKNNPPKIKRKDKQTKQKQQNKTKQKQTKQTKYGRNLKKQKEYR